jgi:hypothetical protein
MATIPGGMYRGTDEDVTTFGVGATFVTSADVDEESSTGDPAIFENLDQFKGLHPALARSSTPKRWSATACRRRCTRAPSATTAKPGCSTDQTDRAALLRPLATARGGRAPFSFPCLRAAGTRSTDQSPTTGQERGSMATGSRQGAKGGSQFSDEEFRIWSPAPTAGRAPKAGPWRS